MNASGVMHISTSATLPPTAIVESVRSVQGVPAPALHSFGPVTGCRLPAPKVFVTRHWLQMIWSHASSVAAEVVEVKPVGDSPNKQDICGAMSTHHLPSKPKLTVAAPHDVALPFPAAFLDAGEVDEPINGGKLRTHREPILSGVAGADADTSRPPF